MAIGTGGILASRAAMLCEIEVTSGTDPSPLAANAVLVEDVIAPGLDVEILERAVLTGFPINMPHLTGKRKQTLSFKVPFHGSGTVDVAPEISPLLQACSFLETTSAGVSVAYTPLASQKLTTTIWLYLGDSILFKSSGMAGTFTIGAAGVGEPLYYEFSMEGTYVAASAGTFPASLIFDAAEPPVFMGGTATFGGGAFLVRSLTIDTAGQLAARPNFSDTHGYAPWAVTGFAPTGTIVVETEAVADKEWLAGLVAGTDYALDVTVGATATNKLDIDAPVCRLTAAPYSEDAGILLTTLEFNLYDSSGNDFLTLLNY